MVMFFFPFMIIISITILDIDAGFRLLDAAIPFVVCVCVCIWSLHQHTHTDKQTDTFNINFILKLWNFFIIKFRKTEKIFLCFRFEWWWLETIGQKWKILRTNNAIYLNGPLFCVIMDSGYKFHDEEKQLNKKKHWESVYFISMNNQKKIVWLLICNANNQPIPPCQNKHSNDDSHILKISFNLIGPLKHENFSSNDDDM